MSKLIFSKISGEKIELKLDPVNVNYLIIKKTMDDFKRMPLKTNLKPFKIDSETIKNINENSSLKIVSDSYSLLNKIYEK